MSLGRRRVVRVPASTANLGPGFDVMAAALALHLELEVRETGTFAVHTELDVPRDRSNLIVRAFERLHPADLAALGDAVAASSVPLVADARLARGDAEVDLPAGLVDARLVTALARARTALLGAS